MKIRLTIEWPEQARQDHETITGVKPTRKELTRRTLHLLSQEFEALRCEVKHMND